MSTLRRWRHRAALAVTCMALRRLGPKKRYKGEVEEVFARGHSTSAQRLGLRRHVPWLDRLGRRLRIYRPQ